MTWRYEDAGDRQIKRLGEWMLREYDELIDEIIEVVEEPLKELIEARKQYIDSNFGVIGGLTLCCGPYEKYPRPKLKERNEQ